MEYEGCDISVCGSFLVKPKSVDCLRSLLENLPQLALEAMALGFKEAQLYDCRTGRWLSIPVKMALNEPEVDTPEIPDLVFGEGLGFDAESLRILEQMRQSEKPMSITDLENDDQEWVNRPLTQMLRMDFQEATELNMKDFWEEDALRYVKRILGQQGLFEHNYEAMLPYGRASFSSTFEVIEFGLHLNRPKRKKRLVTIHRYEPIPQPAWV